MKIHYYFLTRVIARVKPVLLTKKLFIRVFFDPLISSKNEKALSSFAFDLRQQRQQHSSCAFDHRQQRQQQRIDPRSLARNHNSRSRENFDELISGDGRTISFGRKLTTRCRILELLVESEQK
jgi:hypothetical protein